MAVIDVFVTPRRHTIFVRPRNRCWLMKPIKPAFQTYDFLFFPTVSQKVIRRAMMIWKHSFSETARIKHLKKKFRKFLV